MNRQSKEKAFEIIKGTRKWAAAGVNPEATCIFDCIEEIAAEIEAERFNFDFAKYDKVADGSLYLDEVEPLIDLIEIIKEESNMKIINLTPHTITLRDAETHEILEEIPASGVIARAETLKEPLEPINGYPVSHTKYGGAIDLPEPQENTYYVVSALTAQAVRDRADVLIVDGTVRNDSGQIIGCTGFAKL